MPSSSNLQEQECHDWLPCGHWQVTQAVCTHLYVLQSTRREYTESKSLSTSRPAACGGQDIVSVRTGSGEHMPLHYKLLPPPPGTQDRTEVSTTGPCSPVTEKAQEPMVITSSINSQGWQAPPSKDGFFSPCSNKALRAGQRVPRTRSVTPSVTESSPAMEY